MNVKVKMRVEYQILKPSSSATASSLGSDLQDVPELKEACSDLGFSNQASAAQPYLKKLYDQKLRLSTPPPHAPGLAAPTPTFTVRLGSC